MTLEMTDAALQRSKIAPLLDRVEEALDEGQLPVRIFNDEDVFRQEMENIFGTCWVFVAHESEIPKAGDFVQRRIGTDPVVVTRDGKGGINVISNFCRHRGAQVCQTDAGNSRFFKCPYHGWTYNNQGDLVGTPHMHEAYGERLDGKQWGLLRAPRVESRNGFIFASLAAEGPTLSEYLAGAEWMLNLVVGLSPGGMHVVGPPERYRVKADWKTGAENFAGDTYHVDSLHWSTEEISLVRGLQANTAISVTYEIENGHCFNGHTWTKALGPDQVLWNYPGDIKRHLDLSGLDEVQLGVVNDEPPATGTIFPNLSFIRVMAAATTDGSYTVITSFRQWQPVAPGEMELWNWQFAWDFMTEEQAQQSYDVGQFTFGSGGIFEQDDTVAWEGLPRAAQSPWMLRENLELHYDQSRRSPVDREPDPTWRGPGRKRNTGWGEHNQIHFFRHWARAMRGGAAGLIDAKEA